MNERTYVGIDVECFQPRKWKSIGIVVVTYPSGRIVDSMEIGTQHSDVSKTCQEFWDRHPKSFEYNVALGHGTDSDAQECIMCTFLERILTVYPHAFILSDNPSLDIAVVEDIFQRKMNRSMLVRNDRFYPVVDTWSARMTLQSVIGRMIPQNTTCTRDVTLIWNNAETIDHTPRMDAYKVVSRYFSVLDTSASIKDSIRTSKTAHYRTKHRRRESGLDGIDWNIHST
jgi:hypothetical protein